MSWKTEASGPRELESQTVVSLLMWVLRTEWESSARIAMPTPLFGFSGLLLLLFSIYIILCYVVAFCMHIYVLMCLQCLQSPEEGIIAPEIGVVDCFEQPCGYWQPDLGSL